MTLEALRERTDALRTEIGRTVLGQDDIIDLLLIALFARGHVLLEGPPGTAKTLLARSFSAALALDFGRIQFTPDLMPGDVLGTSIFDFRTNAFVLTKGPVFSQVLLADEINRAPPKTQAALLQAMQERQVTAAGHTYRLDRPFLVFATQNPIEQEGTYPLPEAQQDRFMFSVNVGYPTPEEEEEIVVRTTVGQLPKVEQVLDLERLVAIQALLRRLPANRDVVRYGVRLAGATRPGSKVPSAKWIQWGAGPRASQYLAIGARTWAALHGNEVPSREDVRAIATAVLSHRIVLNFEAEAAGLTAEQVVTSLLDEVE